jgi:hypothetical protein
VRCWPSLQVEAMKGQSQFSRVARVKGGCCPIHGVPMWQVGGYRYDADGREVGEAASYCLAACPRKDCGITAASRGPDGPQRLLPQFRHLLEG